MHRPNALRAAAEATARDAQRRPLPATGGESVILPLMQRVSPQARRLLDLVAGLGAGYVLSGSFKMLRDTLLPGRYLLSLAKAKLAGDADHRILEVCRALGMPAELVAPFAERLQPANYVHFGFEETADRAFYKVYMEYWTAWGEEIARNRRSEPFVGGYGYEWDPADGSRSALTRYTCHPMLSVPATLDRVARICEAGDQPMTVMRSLFDAATRHVAEEQMLYLEADEEGNPRRSFDVNLLQSHALLGELQAVWAAMCDHYGVDLERFHAMFTPIRNERLAHIQGGVDREGRDFVTIYYGLERH